MRNSTISRSGPAIQGKPGGPVAGGPQAGGGSQDLLGGRTSNLVRAERILGVVSLNLVCDLRMPACMQAHKASSGGGGRHRHCSGTRPTPRPSCRWQGAIHAGAVGSAAGPRPSWHLRPAWPHRLGCDHPRQQQAGIADQRGESRVPGPAGTPVSRRVSAGLVASLLRTADRCEQVDAGRFLLDGHACAEIGEEPADVAG